VSLNLWKVSHNRKSAWNDLWRMYGNDEYVAEAMDKHSERCTSFSREEGMDKMGFYPVSEDTDVQTVLEKMVDRTKLDEKAADVIRWMVLFGMTPAEPIINSTKQTPSGSWIEDVVQYVHSYQFYRNTVNGRLKAGTANTDKVGVAPYDQRSDSGELVAPFASWQLVMFEYGAKGGLEYADPILNSARKNWKRLQTLEDHMAIARMVRAYMRLIHEITVDMESTPDEIEKAIGQYVDSMTTREVVSWNSGDLTTAYDRPNNPFGVDTDMYVAKRVNMVTGKSIAGDVRPVEGANYQLWRLDDMEWQLRRLISRTKCPARYLGIDLSKPTFGESTPDREEENYELTLIGMQAAFRRGVRQVCDLELLLNGYDPKTAVYRIEMPRTSIRNRQRDAQTEEHLARSINMLREDFDPYTLWAYYHRMTKEQRKEFEKTVGREASDSAGEQAGSDNGEWSSPDEWTAPQAGVSAQDVARHIGEHARREIAEIASAAPPNGQWRHEVDYMVQRAMDGLRSELEASAW